MNEKIREESTENATETEIKEISSDESQINQKRIVRSSLYKNYS